jgi:hypothetical protein
VCADLRRQLEAKLGGFEGVLEAGVQRGEGELREVIPGERPLQREG